MDIDRRDFLRLALLASGAVLPQQLLSHSESSESFRLTLHPDRTIANVPADFIGLSYESAQLRDPDFFSGNNSGLTALVSGLGSGGVLRIGGNTSEYSFWKGDATSAPNSVIAAVNPDTGRAAPAPTTVTPLAIRNLREFLDATSWKLIYGLNLGKGSPGAAADEAAFVHDTIGSRLFAFQIGNEPDLFHQNGLRTADYSYEQFAAEWKHIADAVRARVPSAPISGPATAWNTEWLEKFARQFKGEVILLTQHYYAEGPPTDPSMTIGRLLRPNPKLEADLAKFARISQESGLPFRLAETNSCYSGGKQGVSDTAASALWGGNLMLELAAAGVSGINFHGGGNGWYTPIAGTRQTGFTARPLYYGMLLFNQACPAEIFPVDVDGTGTAPFLTAHGVRSSDQQNKIVIFNKHADMPIKLSMNAIRKTQHATLLPLTAPNLSATTGIALGGAVVDQHGTWNAKRQQSIESINGSFQIILPPASAALISFKPM